MNINKFDKIAYKLMHINFVEFQLNVLSTRTRADNSTLGKLKMKFMQL